MRKLAWLERMLLLAPLTLSIAGCATGPSDPLQPRIVVVCGHVAAFTKDQMAHAADELKTLPEHSVIATVLLPDLSRMRDEARACARPPPSP